jgi:hypothetical protein
MLLLKCSHCPLDRVEEQRGSNEANPDMSAFAARGALGRFPHAVRLRERLLGGLQHHAPGIGELDLVAGAPKQFDAEVALHILDALRERRLRHAETLSGAAKVQLFRDRHETTQLAQAEPVGVVHSHP